jgi:AbrB family looped-hinge helix DNA binding protein
MVSMSSATLSSKYQILIPKEVRDAMGFQPGQKFDFVTVGDSLKIVPQRAMRELFGVASSAKTAAFVRDRSDSARHSKIKIQSKRATKK